METKCDGDLDKYMIDLSRLSIQSLNKSSQ